MSAYSSKRLYLTYFDSRKIKFELFFPQKSLSFILLYNHSMTNYCCFMYFVKTLRGGVKTRFGPKDLPTDGCKHDVYAIVPSCYMFAWAMFTYNYTVPTLSYLPAKTCPASLPK